MGDLARWQPRLAAIIPAFATPGLELAGAVNLVSPQLTTNAQFNTALGRAVHRPALIPVWTTHLLGEVAAIAVGDGGTVLHVELDGLEAFPADVGLEEGGEAVDPLVGASAAGSVKEPGGTWSSLVRMR